MDGSPKIFGELQQPSAIVKVANGEECWELETNNRSLALCVCVLSKWIIFGNTDCMCKPLIWIRTNGGAKT